MSAQTLCLHAAPCTSPSLSNERSSDSAQLKKFMAERFMSVRARRYGWRTCMGGEGQGGCGRSQGMLEHSLWPRSSVISAQFCFHRGRNHANFEAKCNGPAPRMTKSFHSASTGLSDLVQCAESLM